MSPTMKILYGPPGTGKTYLAAREAVKAVDNDAYKKVLEAEGDEGIQNLHRRMVQDGRIVWVTFHPSYSYEDFVEGYRPELNDHGQVCYEVKDGPFIKLCQKARGELVDIYIDEELTKQDNTKYGTVLDKDDGGWVIEVTPARTDEVADRLGKYVDKYTIQKVRDKGLDPSVFSIPGTPLVDLRNYGITSIEHAESLAGVSMPAPDPSKGEDDLHRIGATARRIVGRIVKMSSSDLSNSAHYGAVYRRLIEREAHAGPVKVALVIDEINRADLSRVFGELITLLEIDKREGMPEEKHVVLPYSRSTLSVPQNVSVIGTMNTVDKSISSLDFAMRRRFQFKLVDSDPGLCPDDYGGMDLQKTLSVLNNRLDVLLGNDFRIGHAILMEARLDQIRSDNGWTGDGSHHLAVAVAFRDHIVPLVLEYFHNDWAKAKAVLTADNASLELSLFTTRSPDDTLVASLPDEFDIEETRSYRYASWWSPDHPDWDGDRFSSFIDGISNHS